MLLPLSRPTQTTQQNASRLRVTALSLWLSSSGPIVVFVLLWANLENQLSRGKDQYPVDLTAAYSLLVNFKPPKREEPRQNPRSQELAVKEERHDFCASWRSDCRR
jgi:hypothetical protein